jgi:hypothetical protein
VSLDCVIKVKVRNRSRRSFSVSEGPVSRFIRDSEDYYKAVEKHLRECTVCDPEEALRRFLKNREERFDGKMSGLLLEMAKRYKRRFKDRIPDELVQAFKVGYFMNWNDLDLVEELSVDDVRKAYEGYMSCFRKRARKAVSEGALDRVERYPMYEAQSRIGWRNEDWPRASLENLVPVDVQFYASLSEAEAEEIGGRALAVWLVTRHSWESAIADPDESISALAAARLASEVMGS